MDIVSYVFIQAWKLKNVLLFTSARTDRSLWLTATHFRWEEGYWFFFFFFRNRKTKCLPFTKKYTTIGKRNWLFPHLFHMIWNSLCIMQTIFHTDLLYKCVASNHDEMSTSIRTLETFFSIVKEMIWYTQVIVNVFDAGNHRKSSVCFHLKPSYK